VHKRNFKKILIVRLSSLGDVIQTMPVPTVVRRSYPEAEIGWVIDRELAPAIQGHPDVDRIHLCDRNKWSRRSRNPLNWRTIVHELGELAEEVRAVGYDCALDVQGLLKSAVIPYLAGISPRIGFGHRRELTQFFYTEHYLSKDQYFDPHRMHIDHMMVLAGAIGCDISNYPISLPRITEDDREPISQLLRMHLPQPGPLVVIAPSTQWKSKQWPMEHWLALIRLLLAKTEAQLALIGAANHQPLIGGLLSALGAAADGRILNLAGLTSIRGLYALFEQAVVAVAADTAPLHIAGAARCPLIGLFGATPARRTGPAGEQARMILLTAQPALSCQPCQQRVCRYGTMACMWKLSPEAVFAAVCEVIGSEAGRAAPVLATCNEIRQDNHVGGVQGR
jgi:lipopolysaccharide heptosyltransferase I